MGVLGFQSHDACGGNVRGLMFNASGDRRYETQGYVDGQRMMVQPNAFNPLFLGHFSPVLRRLFTVLSRLPASWRQNREPEKQR